MTEFIENQQWLDFAPNNRAPSHLGTYDPIITNWLLSFDPIGKLSVAFLFIIGWELIFLGLILDACIILILLAVKHIILIPISKAFEVFANKFLGWFFGLCAIFTFGFMAYCIFKLKLWQKLYEFVCASFV